MNWLDLIFMDLRIFLQVPLPIKVVLPKQTWIWVHLIVPSAIRAFEGIRARFTFFSFKARWVLQTSFSLYLHNQWTNFHKLSYAGKLQMRAIHIYMEYTKATTNNWDIRLSVAIKALSANISWTAEQIHTIELVLKSAHQSVSNNIWCISKW